MAASPSRWSMQLYCADSDLPPQPVSTSAASKTTHATLAVRRSVVGDSAHPVTGTFDRRPIGRVVTRRVHCPVVEVRTRIVKCRRILMERRVVDEVAILHK